MTYRYLSSVAVSSKLEAYLTHIIKNSWQSSLQYTTGSHSKHISKEDFKGREKGKDLKFDVLQTI